MNFKDRYSIEDTWHGKVMIMEIYHFAMRHREKEWKLIQTADYFDVSIGLVSENLQLALAIHTNEAILKCETRYAALHKIKK